MALAEAARIMKRRNDGLSWARQTQIHHRDSQHNNGLFLPWHRQQLVHMERIVARLTGHERFAMPYWDWQEHRFLPEWVCDRDSPLYERERARGAVGTSPRRGGRSRPIRPGWPRTGSRPSAASCRRGRGWSRAMATTTSTS